MNAARTLRTAALAALPVLTAAHAAPVVSTFGPLRNRVMPRLAGRGRPDHVALTFDDGPGPRSTPQFLCLLAERRVQATFFLLGSEAHRSPGMAREVAAAGHEIGIHAWLHRPLLLRGPRATYDDFSRASDTVAAITGRQTVLFGPRTASCRPRPTSRPAASASPPCSGRAGERIGQRATPESVHRTVTADLNGAARSCSTTPTAPPRLALDAGGAPPDPRHLSATGLRRRSTARPRLTSTNAEQSGYGLGNASLRQMPRLCQAHPCM
ncbi:polysaccharide deacetylase family protein [Streptomyces sp. NPDC005485]|uniref:polysaccharide deacetylase family protein n=1 Tax=Streptomyces sp. NPDC005485 TaxID=3155591 RepID=UPI0033A8ADFE